MQERDLGLEAGWTSGDARAWPAKKKEKHDWHSEHATTAGTV